MTADSTNSNRQGRRLRPYSALPQGWLRHSEAMRLTDKAKLLFWAMTDHGCEQLTDGRIEDVVLPMLYAVTGADASALAELAKGEIVKRIEGDYQLVDFLEYSRSREDREGARTAAREKKARQRKSVVPRDFPAFVPQPVPPAVPRDTSVDSPAQRERERETLEGESESNQSNNWPSSPAQAAVTDDGRDGDENARDRAGQLAVTVVEPAVRLFQVCDRVDTFRGPGMVRHVASWHRDGSHDITVELDRLGTMVRLQPLQLTLLKATT